MERTRNPRSIPDCNVSRQMSIQSQRYPFSRYGRSKRIASLIGYGDAKHIGMHTAVCPTASNNITRRSEHRLCRLIQLLLNCYPDFLYLISAIRCSNKGNTAKQLTISHSHIVYPIPRRFRTIKPAPKRTTKAIATKSLGEYFRIFMRVLPSPP